MIELWEYQTLIENSKLLLDFCSDSSIFSSSLVQSNNFSNFMEDYL
jgi:hypothetical protein